MLRDGRMMEDDNMMLEDVPLTERQLDEIER